MRRREFFKVGAGGVGAAAVLGGVGSGSDAAAEPWTAARGVPSSAGSGGLFASGVVSGLHSSTEVVLWTRVARSDGTAPTSADWAVATDPRMHRIVARGTTTVNPAVDNTVKILVGRLRPGSTYFFQFRADGHYSPVGRTRTVPSGTGPQRLRLGFCSCQHWEAGYYTAHRSLAEEDIDAVVHLGDYIYESGGSGGIRLDTVGSASTLEDYRAKYRMYRSDAALQAVHANHPFLPVWDDHEFRDNYSKSSLAADPARAAAAYQAWFEYMPVMPVDGTTRVYRSIRWGTLAEIFVLDSRQYRDYEVESLANFGDPGIEMTREGRTLLGEAQRNWLLTGLEAAERDNICWKVVGNPVMIHPARAIDLDEPSIRALLPELPDHAGIYINSDQWDGFQWERDLLLAHLHSEGIDNVVFLTGDIHSFWQATLSVDYDDETSPRVANEFVGGSITSHALDILDPGLAEFIQRLIAIFRPPFNFVDLVRKGYGLIEMTPDRAVVDFKVVDTQTFEAAASTAARFTVANGSTDVLTELF
ncbi:MAG: Phospholipase D [Acidimicrobiales bacterium]|nr:Phospholipase D [Acidimicrobiales bacterium]